MVRTYENRELAEMYIRIVGRINPSDIHFQEQSEFISSAGIKPSHYNFVKYVSFASLIGKRSYKNINQNK